MTPGFVLAGGASKRMGCDKAQLLFQGEPLAARSHRILREGGCDPVYLVGNQPSLPALGLPVIREPAGAHHPARGVIAALSFCPAPTCLIAPCDLPGLRPEDVATLLAFDAPCVAWASGRLHPLLAVFPVACLSRVQNLLKMGGALHQVVDHLPRVELPDRVSWNANTPADLQG